MVGSRDSMAPLARRRGVTGRRAAGCLVAMALLSPGVAACTSDGGERLAAAESPTRGAVPGDPAIEAVTDPSSEGEAAQGAAGGTDNSDESGGDTQERPQVGDAAEIEGFCAVVAELVAAPASELSDEKSVGEFLVRLDDLVARAPEPVRAEIEVMENAIRMFVDPDGADWEADGFDSLADASGRPYSSLGEVGVAIDRFISERCGIESAGFSDFEPEISFEFKGLESVTDEEWAFLDALGAEVAAVIDAHAGESWATDVGRGVSLDSRVELSRELGMQGTEPFTVGEAMAACEAVRAALEVGYPALLLEVKNGETLLARGAAGVPCTPV